MDESIEDEVYRFICNNPGLSVNEIAKKLKISSEKIESTLTKLNRNGLIKFVCDKYNSNEKLSYPKSFLELLPKFFKKNMKNV